MAFWGVENAKRAYDLIPNLDLYSVEDLLTAHRTMMGASFRMPVDSARVTWEFSTGVS